MGGISDGRFIITNDKTLTETDQIKGLGFMLSDKKAGPLKFEVELVRMEQRAP